jgi:cyclin T
MTNARRESERSDPADFFPSYAAKDQLEEQRERVLQAERLLLHTLGFDFNVEHPYKHLLHLAKRLNQSQDLPEDSSRSLTQVAWNFANDRYVYAP